MYLDILILLAVLANVVICIVLVMRQRKNCSKQPYKNYKKLSAPLYVGCDDNCGAFAQTPTDDNLNTDSGPGSCATCLTDYGENTLPCDYVSNYAGSLTASNFCTTYNDIKKNGHCDDMSLASWQYASGGRC
jgi:hypothetical protein